MPFYWETAAVQDNTTAVSYTSNVIYPVYSITSSSNDLYVYRVNGQEWVADSATATVATWDNISWQTVLPITPEEADRRLRETRERRHRMAIRRKRAVRKGQRLLLSLLSEAQKWEYAKHGRFTVCGADGELYVLRKGGTVHQLGKNGVPEWSHCIHLPYSYIDEDSLVSIKLMLESDPLNFHRIANSSRLVKSSVNVSNIPTQMAASAAALAGGMRTINEHMQRLSVAAERARREADRIMRAAQYAEYARELEGQLVAEEAGLILPLNAQQRYVAESLWHAETIGGEVVLAA